MQIVNNEEGRDRAIALPEIISGLLVLVFLLLEVGFEQADMINMLGHEKAGTWPLYCLSFFVLVNTVLSLVHLVHRLIRRHAAGRFLWLQCLLGIAASVFFVDVSLRQEIEVLGIDQASSYRLGTIFAAFMGFFAFVNVRTYLRELKKSDPQRQRPVNPSLTFFYYLVGLVLFSTLILMMPGATVKGSLPLADAFFMCASATSITGLTTVDVASTFTSLGILVLLIDIQIGALGVMTFTYFVLMMVGKRLALRDSMSVSGFLDQQGNNIVPSLLRVIVFVTLTTEAVGAACLYFLWQGHPDIPQMELIGYAIFHAVSAFCNAGITLFPENMATEYVSRAYGVQCVMMSMMLIGTLGFGVYLEWFTRIRRRLAGQRVQKRWSTHSWLVVRVTLITLIVGCVGLGILAWLEPSSHAQNGAYTIWESMWNSIGRSAGFNLTDLSEYGTVYKLFLCMMMLVGGNPAGTGGGVFAPVVALCVLEVLRILRGAQDVEIHNRRIARSTIDRAMATMLLSIFWIGVSTMLVLLMEPQIAAKEDGFINVLFMEVSAFTTTGYDLGAVQELSPWSKFFVSFNMLFGRVGLYTFMLIFIRQKSQSPVRLPETRLPLS